MMEIKDCCIYFFFKGRRLTFRKDFFQGRCGVGSTWVYPPRIGWWSSWQCPVSRCNHEHFFSWLSHPFIWLEHLSLRSKFKWPSLYPKLFLRKNNWPQPPSKSSLGARRQYPTMQCQMQMANCDNTWYVLIYMIVTCGHAQYIYNIYMNTMEHIL